ncbi:MAG: choice-of-anchor C family protein [Chloroflexi bacterium]|nr:choice-of-anchor C family protein [Chloroflexota bacterium]
MKKLILSAAAAALLSASLAGVSSAAAPTIVNGSFETGTSPGSFLQLSSGDGTSIPGWTVIAGTVDYIGTYWPAADGVRSLDLNGSGAGAVRQSFATTVGTTYRVTFSMSGNPAGGAGTKTLTADTGGAPTIFTYEVGTLNPPTLTDMKWATKSFSFTATAATTTLTFTSTTIGLVYGPALDKVRVELATVKPLADCKNGDWRQLRDGQGRLFKNQGDCVSYFATKFRNSGAGAP